MIDQQQYIARQRLTDQKFSENYELGYCEFKSEVMYEIAMLAKWANARASEIEVKKLQFHLKTSRVNNITRCLTS